MTPGIVIDRVMIASFCRKWGVSVLSLFGSALTPDFGPESDIDLLAARRGVACTRDLSLQGFLGSSIVQDAVIRL